MSDRHSHGDVVVVDLGGTHLRLGHLRAGTPQDTFEKIRSERLRVPEARQALIDLVQDYAHRQALLPTAVVLGLPGVLDHGHDTFTHCNNIPQLEGSGLRASLTQSLGCPVILEQDIMLQLLGEWRSGAAQGSDSVFGVYYGTGIGVAWLVDGNPYQQSLAGIQAGHIPIMGEGRRCVCGNADCIEAYASGHRLLELAEQHQQAVETLFARPGTAALQSDLQRFVLYQSYMVATLVTLFSPERVVIGGGIPQMPGYPHDTLVAQVREHLRKPAPSDTVEIHWASLGSQSTLHGALALLDVNRPFF